MWQLTFKIMLRVLLIVFVFHLFLGQVKAQYFVKDKIEFLVEINFDSLEYSKNLQAHLEILRLNPSHVEEQIIKS